MVVNLSKSKVIKEYMLSKEKLEVMLKLQDDLNKVVNPNWATAKYNWTRAIYVEAIEALQYTDWPWWKKQETNKDQLKLELIDIWHFILSSMIEESKYCESSGYIFGLIEAEKEILELEEEDELEGYLDMPIIPDTIEECLESIAYRALKKEFFFLTFFRAMELVDLSFDELYAKYAQKGVLNLFRQHNGLKDGTYIKIWDGKEDNEHLLELSSELDLQNIDFSSKLYNKLVNRYEILCLNK